MKGFGLKERVKSDSSDAASVAGAIYPPAVAELRRMVELDRLVQSPYSADDQAILAQVEAELVGRGE